MSAYVLTLHATADIFDIWAYITENSASTPPSRVARIKSSSISLL